MFLFYFACLFYNETVNRTEIIGKLRKLDLPKEEYRVITGAAMLLYGMREKTHDIDLSCTKELADRLVREGYEVSYGPSGNRKILIGEEIEAIESFFTEDSVRIEGFPVMTVEDLRDLKKKLDRPKDRRDLVLIDAYIREHKDRKGR